MTAELLSNHAFITRLKGFIDSGKRTVVNHLVRQLERVDVQGRTLTQVGGLAA